MANRRMFSMTIIDTDAFLEMPDSSQVLYFHLAMRADDDGFISNPKRIARMIGASDDDLKLLVTKEFLIPFESGVCVIRHWRLHNYIRKDRYTPTFHKFERSLIGLTDNDSYTVNSNEMVERLPDEKKTGDERLPSGRPLVDQMSYQRLPQDRLGKDRLGNEEDILSSKPDDVSEIIKDIVSYLNERTNSNYRETTAKTKKLIQARLNEGFSLEDFRTVIDKKTREWKGTDMEKYLRPETLFGTKFEGYLNQKEKGESTGYEPDYEHGIVL